MATPSYEENVAALDDALEAAKAVTDQPSFIQLRTIIAWPAPNLQGTGKSHGAALGAEEVAATKDVLGFDPDQTFEVSEEVINHTREAGRTRPAGPGRVATGLRQLGAGQPRRQGAL